MIEELPSGVAIAPGVAGAQWQAPGGPASDEPRSLIGGSDANIILSGHPEKLVRLWLAPLLAEHRLCVLSK